MLHANNFYNAEHLNNILPNNTAKILLAWDHNERNSSVALYTWQESHSCRNRLWLEEIKFSSRNFGGPIEIVKTRLTEDTYSMPDVLAQVEQMLKT